MLESIYTILKKIFQKLLEKSVLPPLKIKRLRTITMEIYKIVKKDGPVLLQDLVTTKIIPITSGTSA